MNQAVNTPRRKVDVLGVGIDPMRLDELLERIRVCALSGQRCLIAHANITGLNLACQQDWLRQFYNRADVVYADGMGVLAGARLSGGRIPERHTLADWVWPLAQMAAENGLSLFLLGSAPTVARRAAERLQQRIPGLAVAGTQHGFFNKAPDGWETQAVIEQVNKSEAHILLVGFGMPAQERWLDENWARLQAPVAITVGALFEYLSGDLRRGPEWMTRHYLEWLARALISPRRYAGRYARDIPLFLYYVLRQRLTGNTV